MPFDRGTQAALLKWVNTFPIDRPAESFDDLLDGAILAQMLRDLDPSYDPSELDDNVGSSRWLTRKRNIQSVYKGLFSYIKRENPDLAHQAHTADFRAIAENPDAEGICQVSLRPDEEPPRGPVDTDAVTQILSVFVAAVAFHNDQATRQKYIVAMQTKLDTKSMAALANVIQEKEKDMARAQAAAAREEIIEASMAGRDPGLEAEEEHLRLKTELEEKRRELDYTTKKYADLLSGHERLQETNEEISAKLKAVETQLEELQELHGADESRQIKMLQDKLREQSQLIENQEAEAEAYRIAKERLESEVAELRLKSAKADRLQDQYDELKHGREELEKKANAADRYKEKLKEQKKLEQQNTELRFQLDALKEGQSQFESLMEEKRRLEQTQKQTIDSLGQSEGHLWELREQKQTLENVFKELQVQYAALQDKNNLNESYIAELREQLSNGGAAPPASAGTPTATHTAFNLEEELQHSTDPTALLKSQLSRLEAENNLLRRNLGVGVQNEQLRADLEVAKQREELLQKKYNDVFEKHTVAQEQIQALIDKIPGKELVHCIEDCLHFGKLSILTSDYYRHEAYQNLRKTTLEAEQQLSQERAKSRDLEAEVKDKDRELLSVKTDLDAVEKDQTEALEVLKSTDNLISESLRSELESLRKQYKTLQLENDQQRTQLIDALVSKDKLRKELDETPAPTAPVETPAGTDPAVEEALKSSKSKIEKLRDRVKQQKEQLEKADQERYDLQRRLKAAEQGGAYAAQKATSDQIIKNLQRENALITTAWYDLTARLQSNHVVLQRRQDMPKSWLNKQRQMVNGERLPKGLSSILVFE
ncbi:putative microtubule binding protein [Phaeoacremonium minimum UCRPA7]|uniref:Putative microtubule binding protein n=1 Tax=Phaeoacremonium minimum (strain UCR-PA7) TaxID=1286976 RepID=R8BM20_PHAM7|nr:putative microtubule binding protein [Phaeoacremonium minimum UCRPA7]EOO00421.1 putative microtubule binding protein [Phaeoacremonium minimum UCRPA7]